MCSALSLVLYADSLSPSSIASKRSGCMYICVCNNEWICPPLRAISLLGYAIDALSRLGGQSNASCVSFFRLRLAYLRVGLIPNQFALCALVKWPERRVTLFLTSHFIVHRCFPLVASSSSSVTSPQHVATAHVLFHSATRRITATPAIR